MQVVGYRPRGDEPPALFLAEDGTVRREDLEPGLELSYGLGERHCAGVIDGDAHVHCEEPDAPYCSLHTDRWPCARCMGDCDRPIENCRREHEIYLAAFAPATFKVGVTRSGRLDERLHEQGADRGAHLRTVADGRIAREIEAEIAVDVGDRVRVPTKIEGLHRDVDEDAWEALLSEYDHLETYSFDYGLDLDERPQQETVLSGTVRGGKGRVLVLENGGSTYAVNLRDLVGHELEEGGADRNLQSSLGAFN